MSRVVLEDIRNNARLAKNDEDAFIARLHQINMKEKRGETEKNKKQVILIKNRIEEIEDLMLKVFEKNCARVISDKMCASLSEKYEKEKITLENSLQEVKLDILRAESETVNIEKEIDNLKQYAEITELNRKIVTALIQSIYVSEPRKEEGSKVYDIEIRYKFHNNVKPEKSSAHTDTEPYELGVACNE